MRGRLAHIDILVTAWLWVSQQPIHAQQTVAQALPEIQTSAPCPASDAPNEEPSGPTITIAEVSFTGALQMPISDQEQIADSIKARTSILVASGARGGALELATDEGLARAKAGWQDRGYFKVQIAGEARTLTSTPVSERIALSIHVDEGLRYNLGGIVFRNNKAVGNTALLRGLFPIEDGDIFSREKIATGLANLTKAYGEMGYINFTAIPETGFDDQQKVISVKVDLDEDKQFFVRSVNILGLDEPTQREILKDFPIGQVYNGRLFDLFVARHYSILRFSPDDPSHIGRRLDERTGTVALTLDARTCPFN
jgi:outer membrane protein assembly factor BamA